MNGIPETITREEFSRILDATNKGRSGARMRAALSLMYYAGHRVSEAINIGSDHINWRERMVLVYEGKGKKTRQTVPQPEAWTHLRAWDDIRGECSPWLGSWTRHGVKANLYRLCEKAGIARIHPHVLRHSYATNRLRDGWNLAQVQLMMGHSNIRTTSRYLHAYPAEILRMVYPDGVA